ncbi:hypothetical protein NKT34_13645 [Paenibacillus polysaccharolyticus]|uniref:hypothetical protein n=1 Tax=Paenibacillus polysaccharolyticus TaxID=582692 RepID=UPI00209F8C78|nr:hypothetical protein [Paenibacillus polysaccharolyticus]MCP1134343.1 hypothetical protein [Paenibacillus polysaccharolyticus]
MVTVLIIFVCMALTAAVAYAAFVYGRQIGYTQRDNQALKDEQKVMQTQIEQLTLEYMQLETQYKQEQRDRTRTVNPGSWDPGQLSARG